MPYLLPDDELLFPHPSLADEDGLLAVGGDLSEERLILAYANGIFPWYEEGSPLLWWSPDPRMLLIPDEFKLSKSLRLLDKKNIFDVRIDCNFEAVIRACAMVERKGQESSWITEEMIIAYNNLHKAGLAHSFETYTDGQLVGGLYGISLGKAFFGESMFFKKSNASKIAFLHLVNFAKEKKFDFIDAQQQTDHLKSMGAKAVERKIFLKMLANTIKKETLKGNWSKKL